MLVNGLRWMLYQIRKVFYKLIYRKRYNTGKKGKVSITTSIHLVGNNSTIQLGDRINFRPSSEVFAMNKGRCEIGNDVFINRGVIIGAADYVKVGDNVTIGPYTCVYDHNHSQIKKGEFDTAPIIIDNDVWIGANVMILKGCHIGENAVVGAGCVITHDIPPNVICYQKRDEIFVVREKET